MLSLASGDSEKTDKSWSILFLLLSKSSNDESSTKKTQSIMFSAHPWSDSLRSATSGAMVSAVLFTSGIGSLVAAGGSSMSAGGSREQSEVDGVETGSGSGCALNWGKTLSRHLMTASLQSSPVVSGMSRVVIVGPDTEQ